VFHYTRNKLQNPHFIATAVSYGGHIVQKKNDYGLDGGERSVWDMELKGQRRTPKTKSKSTRPIDNFEFCHGWYVNGSLLYGSSYGSVRVYGSSRTVCERVFIVMPALFLFDLYV
jgi:hypothetical protein